MEPGRYFEGLCSGRHSGGESFGPQDKLHVNTIQRRLATSAAHIYGRKIVSNESFTWLRVPRFLVNYENVKAAADAIFLDGMNAIVNHAMPILQKKPGYLAGLFMHPLI